MKFNTKKSKHLCITKKKNPHVANYSINGARILQRTCEKDLGVLVSNNLSWNSHIKKVARSSNKMLGFIYRTCRNDCDQRTLLTLYRSLVRPQLGYATQVCSPSGIGYRGAPLSI